MTSEEARIQALEESIRVAANTILPSWEQFPDCPAKWFEPQKFENDSERVYGLVRKAARDTKRCEEIELSNTEQEIEHMWRFFFEFISRRQNTSSRNRLIETCHGLVSLNIVSPMNWASSRKKILALYGILESDFVSIFNGDEVVLKDIIRRSRNEDPVSEIASTVPSAFGSKLEVVGMPMDKGGIRPSVPSNSLMLPQKVDSNPPIMHPPHSERSERFTTLIYEEPPKKKTPFSRVCNCMR